MTARPTQLQGFLSSDLEAVTLYKVLQFVPLTVCIKYKEQICISNKYTFKMSNLNCRTHSPKRAYLSSRKKKKWTHEEGKEKSRNGEETTLKIKCKFEVIWSKDFWDVSKLQIAFNIWNHVQLLNIIITEILLLVSVVGFGLSNYAI